ncbi:DNA mismatch repair endonuclease MutL [Candidatus Woesearchaeota archaeon]|nr:DNA mismatch repair endonuclease MutL [Candidatus Woesearchaeota archaeon]MBW3022388.1 DNA mismatch repair endonuclease MutL [Candidatus Woesearchaeota archaeon]
MKIKLLDEELINKIAAGEVIERPASVVKELIENSIDAGSSIINIDLKEGGKSYIKVTDNGSGIEKEDAELAIMRHATSKIENDDDLFNINTLGFRGEALASIAAVSNMKLITKTKEDLEAAKMLVSGGKVLKHEEIGAPVGTSIEVTDLFFNTPARKKHLKSIKAELNHIIDIVTRYSLIHPEISIKLTHDTNTIINSPASDDILSNIVNIYSKDIAKSLIKVKHETDKITVKGFISKPELTRADKDFISIFVNSRYIKNKVITDAIFSAYHTLLHSNRYPVVVLSIKIKPELIDVNVHPQKTEIRFSIEDQIYEAVFNACHKALEDVNMIPEVEADKQSVLVATTADKKKKVAEKVYEHKPEQLALAEVETKVEAETCKIPEVTVLGLVHNCYIIAEDAEGFLVVDMHAAAERVRYERLMKEYKGKGIEVQELLSPINIDLTPVDANVLGSNLKLLDKFGFRIENFGNNSFILRTAPMVIKKLLNKDIILDIIGELKQSKFKTIEEIKEKILIRMACRGSVKQGERIERSEMHKIIKDLHTCEFPYTCPHGRPTIIKFTKSDLEKKFKRVV